MRSKSIFLYKFRIACSFVGRYYCNNLCRYLPKVCKYIASGPRGWLAVLWIRVCFLPDPDPDPTILKITDPDPDLEQKKGTIKFFFL